jgi:hypothetical protein
VLKCKTSNYPSLTVRRFSKALVLGVAISCPTRVSHAQEAVDIVAYFQRVHNARGAGLAHKTKPVDVRPAEPGEVIVTIIKGEGKETQSPPAKPGDMVVRNRCPETGNEQILVQAASFSRRYEGPISARAADGWLPYRPRGVQMRFVVIAEQDGEFTFIAPWGERMVARPGDSIVQDANNQEDTYRVSKAAFACTYEVLRDPQQ